MIHNKKWGKPEQIQHTFWLYDPDDDTEIEVTAHYTIAPAEPDVGINGAWPDVDCYSTPTPLGELCIYLNDDYAERAYEEVATMAEYNPYQEYSRD